MTTASSAPDRAVLRRIARRVMRERGLEPDFSPAALAELDQARGPAGGAGRDVRDLRGLLWCSIDNDDSRDLDQLTVAEALPGGAVKALVAIADVDAVVRRGTALDEHAEENTTSVYTAGAIFPMLPEKLSTDLTSLNLNSNRLAVVMEMVFAADGSPQSSAIYQATVCNHAKLAYRGVAAWLDGHAPIPPSIGAVRGLDENLRLQDGLAHKLKAARHTSGALDFEKIEARPVFEGEEIADLALDPQNRAHDVIAEFMIAANQVAARFLGSKNLCSLRRIVRTPKKWDRIVEIAAERGTRLPKAPDSKALEAFLLAAKASDPLRFPDLSLCVIKLLGRGEYVVQAPGGGADGHFGLAVKDYTHSTAPNRRFPDVIIQRQVKAALAGAPAPYPDDELARLAGHCTEQEDAAKKVERQMAKSAAAMLLRPRIGETFDAIATGANDKGTWVRIFHPPVEGRLDAGFEGVKVGDRLRARLLSTDVERGYIDFAKED